MTTYKNLSYNGDKGAHYGPYILCPRFYHFFTLKRSNMSKGNSTRKKIEGCLKSILKNDPNSYSGIPDLMILHGDMGYARGQGSLRFNRTRVLRTSSPDSAS